MNYTIAGIRIDLPDALINAHFARSLLPFATSAAANRKRGVAGGGIDNPLEAAISSRSNASDLAPDAPSARTPDAGTTAFHSPDGADLILEAGAEITPGPGYRELYRFDFPDADADCRFGCDTAGYLLEMTPRDGSGATCYRMAYGAAQALCNASPEHHPALFRFGVWTLFNLAALPHGAVAFHSSVIRYRGQGVLFLGESGTGKSTHTRLWREHIAGAELLNDDSPIVRLTQGDARVYGSPWSGKTPCYRNASCPIGAVVRLSQAPHNRIRRLRPIEAIGALLPSAPPAFARDERLSDAVCALLSQLIAQVPVYHLECLPDAEAARLACRTIFNDPTR